MYTCITVGQEWVSLINRKCPLFWESLIERCAEEGCHALVKYVPRLALFCNLRMFLRQYGASCALCQMYCICVLWKSYVDSFSFILKANLWRLCLRTNLLTRVCVVWGRISRRQSCVLEWANTVCFSFHIEIDLWPSVFRIAYEAQERRTTIEVWPISMAINLEF